MNPISLAPTRLSRRPPSQESVSSLASTSSSNFEATDSNVEEINPKVEELCESPREIQASFDNRTLTSSTSIISVDNTQAKKRGRPRKSIDVVLEKQNTKSARSKTGCLTCRRRKKKCDEAKPECRNCMKNAITCEGYIGKAIWQSGKNARRRSIVNGLMTAQISLPRALQSITPGIESDVDVKFLDHYFFDLSNVLTVHDNASNPFKDIIFRMAIGDDENLLLRHSLLCFAGLHLYRRDPKKIFNDRQQYHYQHYLNIMRHDCKKAKIDQGNVHSIDQHSMITTSIVQCLIAICRGSTDGEYRWHMDIVRDIVPDYRSSDPAVQDFFGEFLMYHDGLNTTTSLDRRPASIIEDNGESSVLAITPDGVFTGVKDGLLKIIVRISRLRDKIRLRMSEGIEPIRDYPIISCSLKIEQDLKAWSPVQEPYTPSWYFACFHQRCVWIYLYRTLKLSKPSEGLTVAVDEALESLQDLHATESTQSVLLSPLFLLGCAAFQEWQRPPIEVAFENLRTYSNLGNIDQARFVVRKVWELMDAGDERSWDWERVMADMDIDLLIT